MSYRIHNLQVTELQSSNQLKKIQHHTIQHQQPWSVTRKSKYKSKIIRSINSTSQLLHFKILSKNNDPLTMFRMGISNGTGLNVSHGAWPTEGHLDGADAAQPNKSSHNNPHGALHQTFGPRQEWRENKMWHCQ